MIHHSLLPQASVRSTLLALLLLSGCMVGPDYRKPDTATAGWKNTPELGEGTIGARWWEIYNDPILNSLEDQGAQASPQLTAAIARVTQARAIARITQADFPRIVARTRRAAVAAFGRGYDQPSK